MAKETKKAAPPAPDYAALNKKLAELEAKGFPERPTTRLEHVAAKIRFLSIVVPNEAMCDEALLGFGCLLGDLADEIADVADDLSEEAKKREAHRSTAGS